jgi:hypothetical protein
MTDATTENVDLVVLGKAMLVVGKILVAGAPPSPPPRHPDSGCGDAVYKLTGSSDLIEKLKSYGNQGKMK